MRLIDADVLKEKVKKYHDMEDERDGVSEGREGALYDTLIDIDNAPTVAAIPVDWLREMMLDSPPEHSVAAWRVLNEWKRRGKDAAD